MIFLWALIGARISRMAGGGWPKTPFGLDAWLYSVPYGIVTFLALLPTSGGVFAPYPYWIWIGAALATVAAMLGKRNGTRVFFDMGTWEAEPREPHKLEYFMKPLKGRVSEFTYDFIGLFLKGFLTTIVTAALVGYCYPLFGVYILVGGLMQPIAYSAGWYIGIYPTETGEHLNGFFAWFSLWHILLMLLR